MLYNLVEFLISSTNLVSNLSAHFQFSLSLQQVFLFFLDSLADKNNEPRKIEKQYFISVFPAAWHLLKNYFHECV